MSLFQPWRSAMPCGSSRFNKARAWLSVSAALLPGGVSGLTVTGVLTGGGVITAVAAGSLAAAGMVGAGTGAGGRLVGVVLQAQSPASNARLKR